jgi:ketosteroid isomerase-like protein
LGILLAKSCPPTSRGLYPEDMADGDIELIRAVYQAWNRRDFDAINEFLAPEVELDASARVFNPDRYRGHEGFRRLADEVLDVWEEWGLEPKEFIQEGNHVLVAVRAHARGKGSGVELDELAYNIWTIRDGKVVRIVFHYERDKALRAAGLPEGTDAARSG